MIHQESVIKVDCVVRKDSEYRGLEFHRRRRITIEDFETFLVSKEDLILSKLVWARDSRSELQLGDVKNLLATGYDNDYLEHWAVLLGVESLLAELRMRDTPPDVERMVRERLMAMSPEERFVRGALMFDAARAMVLASLDPRLEGLERKRALYERIYGEPLSVG